MLKATFKELFELSVTLVEKVQVGVDWLVTVTVYVPAAKPVLF